MTTSASNLKNCYLFSFTMDIRQRARVLLYNKIKEPPRLKTLELRSVLKQRLNKHSEKSAKAVGRITRHARAITRSIRSAFTRLHSSAESCSRFARLLVCRRLNTKYPLSGITCPPWDCSGRRDDSVALGRVGVTFRRDELDTGRGLKLVASSLFTFE